MVNRTLTLPVPAAGSTPIQGTSLRADQAQPLGALSATRTWCWVGSTADRRRRHGIPARRGALRDRNLLLRDHEAAAARRPVGIRQDRVVHRRGALARVRREADPRRVGRRRPRAVAGRRHVEAAIASAGGNFRRVVGDADLALVGGRFNEARAGRTARDRRTRGREPRCHENGTAWKRELLAYSDPSRSVIWMQIERPQALRCSAKSPGWLVTRTLSRSGLCAHVDDDTGRCQPGAPARCGPREPFMAPSRCRAAASCCWRCRPFRTATLASRRQTPA